MISSNLMGGLGNILFQISAAVSLGLNNKDKTVFDVSRYPSPHGNINNYRNTILRNINIDKFYPKKIYQEPFFHYKDIPYQENLILSGYFQSEKYFVENQNFIRNLFDVDEQSKKIIEKIISTDILYKSCSLHIRRGDYLSYPDHHPVCDIEYYKNAMNFISNKTIILFSNDIDWCKKNLILDGKELIYIENNFDYIDLWMMSLCENNIIANSSFSWWGAWLNKNNNKIVVAPKKWFGNALQHNTKDLYPEKWIVI